MKMDSSDRYRDSSVVNLDHSKLLGRRDGVKKKRDIEYNGYNFRDEDRALEMERQAYQGIRN